MPISRVITAVVECTSSVGGSPIMPTRRTPPFFGPAGGGLPRLPAPAPAPARGAAPGKRRGAPPASTAPPRRGRGAPAAALAPGGPGARHGPPRPPRAIKERDHAGARGGHPPGRL